MEKNRDNKEIGRTLSGLRLGYTTGSCAAAAAKAAVGMLLSGEEIRQVRLLTPAGILLYLDVEEIRREQEMVRCGVRKYSGDDPDVTDGMLVVVSAEKTDAPANAEGDITFREGRTVLAGGEGIGRVTKPGLEQRPGAPAINRVPRSMIFAAVREMCSRHGYEGWIRVTVSIPGGEETAKKTMNPRLGILGGLSVLGTTGIVEPMSEKALTDTIFLEMKLFSGSGRKYCCAVPGNYGAGYLRELGLDPEQAVRFSNYAGDLIDDACLLGMEGLLLVGHAGKLVKLAAGVMNTHSRQADCRMEILGVHAAMAGASRETVCRIMDSINTEEAVRILRQCGLLEEVMKTVLERIQFYLDQRAGGRLRIGAILFSSEEGILGRTETAGILEQRIREENRKEQKKTGGLEQ